MYVTTMEKVVQSEMMPVMLAWHLVEWGIDCHDRETVTGVEEAYSVTDEVGVDDRFLGMDDVPHGEAQVVDPYLSVVRVQEVRGLYPVGKWMEPFRDAPSHFLSYVDLGDSLV